MSIADQNKMRELEQRVEQLEKIVEELCKAAAARETLKLKKNG